MRVPDPSLKRLRLIRDGFEVNPPMASPSAPPPLGERTGGTAVDRRAEDDRREGPARGGEPLVPRAPLRGPRSLQAVKALDRGTILLVEDDELILELAQLILEAEGYRILPATNAADALWVLQRDIAVDLLFTDILMPGTTGLERAEAARGLRPHLRIAFTSGHYQHKIDARAEPDAVLEKPWLAADLIEFVRRQLQRPPT